jgi:regulatory Fis family protein
MSEVVSLFDPEIARLVAALEDERGNVTQAAKRLGVGSAWLRAKIVATKELGEAMDEIMERHVDKAIGIIRAGLDEESYLVRFYAAKEFLRSETARKRGFGTAQNAQVIEASGGRPSVIVLKWIGDDKPEPKQIEGPLE